MKFIGLAVYLSVLFICEAHAASVCFQKDCIEVEIASNPEQLKRGLQGRDHLNENQGMLFVFKKDDIYRFWMKDMKMAIDMIWIDAKRRIVTIAPSRLPCVQDPCEVYEPMAKARYVLEVQEGYAAKHHLKPGDALHFYDIH